MPASTRTRKASTPGHRASPASWSSAPTAATASTPRRALARNARTPSAPTATWPARPTPRASGFGTARTAAPRPTAWTPARPSIPTRPKSSTPSSCAPRIAVWRSADKVMRFRTLALVMLLAAPAGAQSTGVATLPAEDARLTEARRLFLDGVELVKRAEWASALTAFERSEALHPHPVTAFNRGACQRALGRYAFARETLRQALGTRDDAGQ